MNRAEFNLPYDMFTIVSFALALTAVLGGVWWACTADHDESSGS
jgi:hypothetical protein